MSVHGRTLLPDAPAAALAGAPGPARRGARRTLKRWLGSDNPTWWIAPLALLLCLFYLYPAAQVIHFSFTSTTLLNASSELTLDSYTSVFDGTDVGRVLWVTARFVIGSVVGQLLLGLLIAVALDYGTRRRLRGTTALRVIILASWIVPGVSSGIIWQLLLNEASYGFLNGVLQMLSLPPVAWLSDPDIAIWSATLANIWRGTAFTMILLYAGLQVIPRSLYEASAVDGAGALRTFWYVTLPQLRPVLMVNTILITLFTLNTFDLILPLTGGGPGRATEVLALYVYNMVFRNFDLSAGSVLAVVMLLISLLLTVVYTRLLADEGDAE